MIRLHSVIMMAVCAASVGAQTIVTANMTSASTSLVDVATGKTVATLPTGEGPHEVAISHDGKWAVVSVYGNRASTGHSLLVVDLAKAVESRRIELGDYTRPHGMAFLPGDKTLLVTSEASKKVLVVDFASGAVDTTMTTDQTTTHMIALVPDGSRAYTTNVGAGTISVLDIPGRKQERTITVAPSIEGIAVAPNGKEVWVAGRTTKTVYAVETATGKILQEMTGYGLPYRIAITPDGRTAVVTDPGDEKVHIVDAVTYKTRTVIDIPRLADASAPGGGGASPQGVTIGPDGRTAYVTLKAAGHVVQIDLASGKIMREFVVGGGSDGIGIAPGAARAAP